MTQNDVERKQLVLIEYLQEIINEYTKGQVDEFRKPIKWKVKAEYSTNDNDKRVVTVQEQSGLKTVFYGNCTPINNYYMIDIYGLSIKECKNLSLLIGSLIGQNIKRDTTFNGKKEKWQIIFKQWVNPQAIEYLDIRRVGYNSTLKCIVNKYYEEK